MNATLRLGYHFFLSLLLLSSCSSEKTTDDHPVKTVTLTRDSLSITVEPGMGGRLVSLTYGGREMLPTQRDSSGYTYGSTAWPAPQSEWNWPPPAAIDREAYTVQEVDAHSLLLISREDPETGLVLQKRYRLGPDSDVGLTYWITNHGDTTRSVAAWEVTRLPYGGAFWFYSDSLRVERGAGTTVQSRDSLRRITVDDRHTGKIKVFADLDSVPVSYTNDGLVLEKHTVVTDFYRVAPGQAPLEIYLDPAAGFVEFELHGDYRKLGYGETSTLRTKWVIRRAEE
ncbi:uncharacterized protein DUF4380 [Neolewinella xylanilytica]|uniref:Uncharacterized protein DUF4380 n=1 Tax=Neolewinella xylanilytica TaxID=1514080 RepID=A0A2S6I3D5_9BACT|nr:DUF4380 domain-containing protein [Neolewinella xylanilytica]PPK85687.1 uncharacterized protein DUF4380 [Neolewinella xylanilytica]